MFLKTPSVSKGVATPMSQDDLAATLRFLKANLAFLEAQERSIAVRKKETIAFINKLESAGASPSSQPEVLVVFQPVFSLVVQPLLLLMFLPPVFVSVFLLLMLLLPRLKN